MKRNAVMPRHVPQGQGVFQQLPQMRPVAAQLQHRDAPFEGRLHRRHNTACTALGCIHHQVQR